MAHDNASWPSEPHTEPGRAGPSWDGLDLQPTKCPFVNISKVFLFFMIFLFFVIVNVKCKVVDLKTKNRKQKSEREKLLCSMQQILAAEWSGWGFTRAEANYLICGNKKSNTKKIRKTESWTLKTESRKVTVVASRDVPQAAAAALEPHSMHLKIWIRKFSRITIQWITSAC